MLTSKKIKPKFLNINIDMSEVFDLIIKLSDEGVSCNLMSDYLKASIYLLLTCNHNCIYDNYDLVNYVNMYDKASSTLFSNNLEKNTDEIDWLIKNKILSVFNFDDIEVIKKSIINIKTQSSFNYIFKMDYYGIKEHLPHVTSN